MRAPTAQAATPNAISSRQRAMKTLSTRTHFSRTSAAGLAKAAHSSSVSLAQAVSSRLASTPDIVPSRPASAGAKPSAAGMRASRSASSAASSASVCAARISAASRARALSCAACSAFVRRPRCLAGGGPGSATGLVASGITASAGAGEEPKLPESPCSSGASPPRRPVFPPARSERLSSFAGFSIPRATSVLRRALGVHRPFAAPFLSLGAQKIPDLTLHVNVFSSRAPCYPAVCDDRSRRAAVALNRPKPDESRRQPERPY